MNPSILAPPFHVQQTALTQRNGFPYRDFHDSISALWSKMWRPACAGGSYPFMDAKAEDFDPVFADMISLAADDSKFLYQPDRYAQVFFPKAEELHRLAQQAEAHGDLTRARDLFLRAAAVYRIARFPLNRSEISQVAWERGKAVYLEAAKLLDPPVIPVDIPFTHCDKSTEDTDAPIQAYLRIPSGASPKEGWPLVLFICGLDSYRTDATTRTQVHIEHGFASLCFEIPGTGDCPAAPNDPDSPDRVMGSIFDWLDSESTYLKLNPRQIVARGISTGGFYAIRAAHVNADRLLAAVAQGGGCHYMFDANWIGAQNQMDYPFALSEALAYKFGYREQNGLTDYCEQGHKFSLLTAGLLEKQSCKLLLINGMEDSVFPIEDNFVVAASGKNKDVIIRANRGHMGNPGAEPFVYAWLDEAIAK